MIDNLNLFLTIKFFLSSVWLTNSYQSYSFPLSPNPMTVTASFIRLFLYHLLNQ